MRRLVTTVLLALVFGPASALAQEPPPSQPPPATTPPPAATPPPKPVPADGRVAFAFERVIDGSTITGRAFRVRITVSRFVAGQTLAVSIRRGGRVIEQTTRSVTRGPAGRGVVLLDYRTGKPGELSIKAVHPASDGQRFFSGVSRRLRVLSPRIGSGSSGGAVRLLQAGLARLGYAVPRSGRFDDGTGRAVLAFRKVNRMPRTTAVNRAILDRLLDGEGGFKVRFPGRGRHVEVSLSRQVLALIDEDGSVYRAYHTSTGTSATPTIRGSFRFYRKQPGTNSKGMIHSNYFIRGYAIHGYKSVPIYPASHGCLRVPPPNALFISRWIRLSDRIDVYY